MNLFVYDVKEAWSALKTSRHFLFNIVITMGISLGAVLCIVTMAYILLLKPLPYPNQEQLYKVDFNLVNGDFGTTAFFYPAMMDMYKKQQVFEKIAISHYANVSLSSKSEQPLMANAYVTPEWFELFDVRMVKGRRFEISESPGKFNPVAIISHKTWQKNFAGNDNILNEMVSFNGVTFRIVGVVSESFIEPMISDGNNETQFWIPWEYNLTSQKARHDWLQMDSSNVVIGKLRKSFSVSSAELSITPLLEDKWRSESSKISFFNDMTSNVKLRRLKSVILGDITDTLFLFLFGAVGMLVITCTNISNLFISRIAERQQVLAIRIAVGAKKSALFKGLFIEAIIVMFFSLIVSVIIANIGLLVIQHYLAHLVPRVNELELNYFYFILASFILLLFAGLFAQIGIKANNFGKLNTTLKNSGKGTGIQVSKTIRQLLVSIQIAIAIAIILINVNLFSHSLNRILHPSGMDVTNIVRLNLSTSSSLPMSKDEVETVVSEFKMRIQNLPQVDLVSHSASALDSFFWTVFQSEEKGEKSPIIISFEIKSVDDNYFRMIDQPLVEGDYFSSTDIQDQRNVIIVNDVYASGKSHNESVIGNRLAIDSFEKKLIIGVVQGVAMPGEKEIPSRIYKPSSRSSMNLMIKLKKNQSLNRYQLAIMLREINEQFSIFAFDTLENMRNNKLFSEYTILVMTAALSILTLFLAGVGLFSIFSYSTKIRRFELGTRLAIGAKRKDLIQLLIISSAIPVLLGIMASFIGLFSIYLSFTKELSEYMNIQLFYSIFITLSLVGFVSFIAIYFPLKKIFNQPAIYSLRGGVYP